MEVTAEKPSEKNIDTIDEDLSAKLSLKSATSTISISSSASSKESVVHNFSQAAPISPTVEQIIPKLEPVHPKFDPIDPRIEIRKRSKEIEIERAIGRKNRTNSTSSTSSSDSNKSDNLSEEIPKYFPRKSSFSSPSDVDTEMKNVQIFGEEPGECVIYDEAKVSKKIRTNTSESSDSDSSASVVSFEIDEPNISIRSDVEICLPKENPIVCLPKENPIVRTEKIESSDLSEDESNKAVQRQNSTSSSSEDEPK